MRQRRATGAAERRRCHGRQIRSGPTDKYADTPKERSAGDKKADDELKRGLKDSFPASDPPSNTQPPKTVDDAG
ncbi:hypothetical protein [Bradyrhizobium japonicum]|jgi:hypothetical protein|uniref:Uncharacterized protein n=1 Tax=Bradyrhizobium japonicum TaxID=375 RepID=A0A1L3F986_BRAJP|nr:hypothetical protein [Bradyrhizobium japonicum]APG09848.1 hypothetical protein BKD09_16045 [Bradyrhizobium japonicum]MCP1765998.1 hypothetical protein [Bradyrhizobium japonicum]MCP1788135.1 hypothetical protein [Bradyrhizobium japonicum]MCP1810011.1 hypothetical protein [Bradyrhizobium japonicum]MCP1818945.1 hypothetical protein [Bradyrhizobium japonicum]